jgi:hypothetical protein
MDGPSNHEPFTGTRSSKKARERNRHTFINKRVEHLGIAGSGMKNEDEGEKQPQASTALEQGIG